jgi:hypothetical protein
MSLAHPENTTMRSILKGLLISQDSSLAAIAGWLSFSLEAAQIYSELFFNVRDRRNEPGYIASLLHPDGIRIDENSGSEELALRFNACFHLIESEFLGDGVRGAFVVTSEHDDFQAKLVKLRYRFGRGCFDRTQ